MASHLLATPLSDRALRYGSTLTSVVNVDRWIGASDWVYAPLEQPVTTHKPLAVTVHDLYAFEKSHQRKRDWAGVSWHVRMRRILARADVILTVSAFTRSRLVELFKVKSPERIEVVGNGGTEGFCRGVQPGDEVVLRRYGLSSEGYTLFPGSLTRRKGGDLLLRVARLADQRGAGQCFVVIGRRHDPDLLGELQVLKAAHPAFPVTLLGYVPKSDLAALYRHATATLFPSRYEGFGIPVVEALASGCPLFISSQPALVEVAAGRATVIDDVPLSVLDALGGARRADAHAPVEHTWAQCAARVVNAMRVRAC